MLTIACVAALLAAAIHVYIFVLESLRWERPSTRRIFGASAEQAAATAQMAYNQGFYNLFLAVGAVAGAASVAAGYQTAGVTLIVLTTGSMLGAAVVLITSDHTKTRAATTQGLFPALTLLALAAWSLA